MELRFDGLYSRVAAIGRSSIRGILLVPVSLLPGLPGSWSSAYERWKLNIIKSCLAGYTETQEQGPDLASDNGYLQTRSSVLESLEPGERVTGPYLAQRKYEPW